MAKYKRILLKLSGESLMGNQHFGIDPERLSDYARQIKEVYDMGVQIGIVIGGGNIFRGLSGTGKGFDRVKGDQMGMCATVINSLALSSALGALGVKNKVMTAIRMEPIGEFYKVQRHYIRRDLHARTEGDGPYRNDNVQGEQPAYLCVQHGRGRQPQACNGRRKHRNAGA